MNRSVLFCLTIFAAVALLSAGGFARAGEFPERPNIVLVMTDDGG